MPEPTNDLPPGVWGIYKDVNLILNPAFSRHYRLVAQALRASHLSLPLRSRRAHSPFRRSLSHSSIRSSTSRNTTASLVIYTYLWKNIAQWGRSTPARKRRR